MRMRARVFRSTAKITSDACCPDSASPMRRDTTTQRRNKRTDTNKPCPAGRVHDCRGEIETNPLNSPMGIN